MRIEPTLFVSRCSPSDTVSVVIPCLNEEAFIGECINSVLANDYPRELIEIFIVDGMSTDSTRDIVAGDSNGEGTGLRRRMSDHATCDPSTIRQCQQTRWQQEHSRHLTRRNDWLAKVL